MGAELAAGVEIPDNLKLFTGVSLIKATPADTPYSPGASLTGGANWGFAPGWLLSADGVYVSAMHEATESRVAGSTNPVAVGAHFLLSARLARRFSAGGPNGIRGEVFLAGENLTDRQFAYQHGYPIPGINVMVGLRLNR